MGHEVELAKKTEPSRKSSEAVPSTSRPQPPQAYSVGVPAFLRQHRDAAEEAEQACRPDPLGDWRGPVCEPVPENPLAGYELLPFALDAGQLQELQDAAYRREHLRRGLAFFGPQGLPFAQAQLAAFTAPSTDYVSREVLLAALMPAMLAAARTRGDVEPYVREIRRNETARLVLEPLHNPLVNVELVDPEGKEDAPSRLKFVVDFKELPDDHGSIPLSSLTSISRMSYDLIAATAAVNARQLSDLALLQAQTEWMNADYLKMLIDVKGAAHKYPYRQVESAGTFAVDLKKQVDHLAEYLWRENQDQAPTVSKMQASANALQVAAKEALEAATLLRKDTDPGSFTTGEYWENNAQDIRNARDVASEEGGVWGNLKVAGNTIGLGANKVVRAFGSVATGGYMQTKAARTSAYRRGEISYDNYSGFSATDVLKGAVQDFAIAIPGYGGKLGDAAVGWFGVEAGTASAYVLEGQAVGFVSGTAGAVANDGSSWAAAKLAGSEDERRFQERQIGGWESWLEAGSEGATFGTLFGAGRAAFPKPTALPVEPSRSAVTEPVEGVDPAEPTLTSPLVEEPFPVSKMETEPAPGMMARLKRAALYKLTAAALEGTEPLRDVVGDFGRASEQLSEPARTVAADAASGGGELLSVVEEPAPLVAVEPAEVQITEATPTAGPTTPLTSQGERAAPGTRLTTRSQWKEQEGARRWGIAVDRLVNTLEPGAAVSPGAQAPEAAPSVTDINIQSAIRRAIAEIRDSGVRSAGNAAYGTRLHAALARILRAEQLPADVTMQVEQALSTIATLPDVTVRDWLWTDGQAYRWLEDSLRSEVLDTNVRDLRLDARLLVGDHSVVFDLTSREVETHLAKTMLYAALLAQDGKMSRVQEYYWVRWNWRGQ